MKLTMKDLCDAFSIEERMYCPPNRERRTKHPNDDIDYRHQIFDNPRIWEALETAANTGQFQNIFCAAQVLEALWNLSASHLGSPNLNRNPCSSVQVDSAAAQLDIIRNQIANIGSEVDTNNDNPNQVLLTLTSGMHCEIGPRY